MYDDLKTLIWFLRQGPKFYATMIALIFRKFRLLKDSPEHIEIERKWCEENLISYEECMNKLEFKLFKTEVFSPDHMKEVKRRLEISDSDFGGQGHIFLLYSVCENLEATKVLETGVAYGWSSASILSSISKRLGKLISIDMPMVRQTDYHLIGTAVHEDLKDNWELLREPDKHGLNKAIKKHNYSYDLAHYDSDKSYYGRKWSQPLIWKYLRKGGVFISDDIEDNSAFREFVVLHHLDFSVLKFQGKYVGVIRKDT
tara:strand:- start:144 stop:914 length:771 start_codon:yes stop_codon:yes gene_type:complete